MARPPNRPPAKPLTVQRERLRRAYPDGSGLVVNSSLYWTCALTPTEWSDTYEILLVHRRRSPPKVHVISPKLHGPRRLPHVYTHNQLCLYLPGAWDDHQLIVDTIICWTMEWLFHYEIWAATGSWEGGGLHPTSSGRGGQSRTRLRQARRRRVSERKEIEEAFLTLHPDRSAEGLLNLGPPLEAPRAKPGPADRDPRGTVHTVKQIPSA